MTTADTIHQLRAELWNLTYTHWKTETLFSIQWWSSIVLIAIAYAIWWVIVDKRRLSQILLFGSLIAVGRTMMDVVGTNAAFWSYEICPTPFSPCPLQLDVTVIALAFMVIYQYCHSWKKFLVWTIVATGIISFVFFPILITFGFLKLYNWNVIYSFVLIIVIASFSRWVVLGVLNLQQIQK
ncbi:MAG TPA: CBO0543 family protein [Desulfosporosinus sp.]|nr:CBO0543 family protein [Desulfosporosinus sp.]